MSERLEGACLCGKVTFEVTEPQVMATCHCTRCQRWTGTASSTVVVVDEKNLNVKTGPELMKHFKDGKFADRVFCSNCGSGIYAGSGTLYVSAGLLKDVPMKPAFHLQVANKAPWDEIGGNAPQYQEWSS
jgi:hypothetical protein